MIYQKKQRTQPFKNNYIFFKDKIFLYDKDHKQLTPNGKIVNINEVNILDKRFLAEETMDNFAIKLNTNKQKLIKITAQKDELFEQTFTIQYKNEEYILASNIRQISWRLCEMICIKKQNKA